jgi:hypothetical protein
MAKTIMTGYEVEHPAPFAGAAPSGLLFAALLTPPIAWFLQLCVDYGLTSQACFPREKLLPTGLGISPAVWPGSLALNLAALVVAGLALFASLWIWRRTRHEVPSGHGLIEGAEGRTRFLAVWGFWIGVWFAIGILFNTIAMLELPSCGA